MLLAIDIGNSHTKLGVFRKNKLISTQRFPTFTHESQKEFLSHVNRLCRSARITHKTITDAVVSSVVPKQSVFIKNFLRKKFGITPLMISGKLDVGMKIRYKNPSKLGADRLCNAVAAFHKFGAPCIVIDFGTATKYEVISKQGEYLGGAIAVGLESAAITLHNRTAQLPPIALQFPKRVVGTTTIESMQSGILFSAIDAMEGMISRIKKIYGMNIRVIATGGFANLIARQNNNIDHIETHLVLEGARLIYERISSSKRK